MKFPAVRKYHLMQTERLFRVLVIEDETLLRWSLAEVLRRGGHTVPEAGSASEARAAMTGGTDDIDVVLLDVRLPDSTDLRLLEEVRRRMRHRGDHDERVRHSRGTEARPRVRRHTVVAAARR